MSIVRQFYKKLCGSFFDEQILSAKAFLAQTVIQALFQRCKKVTPSMKCLPNEQKQEQIIPTATCAAGYKDPEYLSPTCAGVQFYSNEPTKNTKHFKRTLGNGKISPEMRKYVPTNFINFGSTTTTTDGVLRLPLVLEDEMINTRLLHRDTKELIESKTNFQALSYFSRWGCTSCMLCENSYSLEFHKLFDVPPRVSTLPVLDYVGISSPECWQFVERDGVYKFGQHVPGGRLQRTCIRSGRVTSDIPIGGIYELCLKYPKRLYGLGKGITTINRIFLPRLMGFADFDDISLGCSEAATDDIPVGIIGYCFFCGVEEICRSNDTIDKCHIEMPESDIKVDNHSSFPKKRSERKLPMKDLFSHFKNLTSGFPAPPGRIYKAFEPRTGEFKMFLASNLTSCPLCRFKIKAASLTNLAFPGSLSPARLLTNITSLDIRSFPPNIPLIGINHINTNVNH